MTYIFILWSVLCDGRVIVKTGTKEPVCTIATNIKENSFWQANIIKSIIPCRFLILNEFCPWGKEQDVSICFWHGMHITETDTMKWAQVLFHIKIEAYIVILCVEDDNMPLRIKC